MNVVLVSYTPDPERVVAVAARQCYSPLGAAELAEGLSDEKVGELIRTIIEAGHLSPTEHASFTFAIEGVSRALSHQLVRHRIASYSQQSQRYVSERGFGYVTPPSIAADPRARAIFERQMEHARDAYRELVALVPREDARFVLPNACETRLVMTMNCRSLYNFFERRLCERAQWEIRELAREMLRRVRDVAPRLFSWVGPPCEMRGYCPEGKMSCGRAEGTSRCLIAAADLVKDKCDDGTGAEG
ncbi:MAG: FAD-dependent thymidylate synthase [Firmicutes bacterium]|jgi:thymidylate synthase (FAD)|nr:FAD-dependent thymidylate synthase [Bacillota bacterium]MDH7496009.1 FAD-dependent thymidylate synthase [Bacillota bacterium]